MWYGWLILAASMGQATQPAPAGPRIVIHPPITATTQPAVVLATHPATVAEAAAPATQPAATARVAAPSAATPPVAAAPVAHAPVAPPPAATQPALAATPATRPAQAAAPPVAPPAAPPIPGTAAAPATQPAPAVARIQPPATQPSALTQLAAAFQGSPATQPEAATVLPALSGEEVEIIPTPDGGLIIQGNEKDVEILQAFVRQLQRQTVPAMQVEVVELKNARAADIVTNLQNFWNKAKTPPGRGVPAPEDQIALVAEPRSNSLMIAASPINLPEVKQLIDNLDKSTLQLKPYLYQLKFIKAEEAAKTIQTVLAGKSAKLGGGGAMFDLVADPRTNSLVITASPSDYEQIKTLVELIDVEPSVEAGGQVKLAIYPLKKAVATELVNVLKDMLNTSQGAAAAQEQIRRLQLVVKRPEGEKPLSPLNLEKPIKVLADTGTNSVVVASVESNLAPIGELVEILDQMPLSEEVLVRIYPLEHSDAQTLMTSIREMFSQGKNLTDVPGKTQVVGRTPENPGGRGLISNVALSVDARTNALVVAGRAEQLLLVEQIVKAVDVPSEVGRFTPRIVQLEHSDVTKLSAALQKIIDARQQVLQKAGPTAASREQVLLIPDPRTNSIIIVAKDDNYQEMAVLAKQLDIRSAEYLGQIHIINLEKLNAADLAPKLRELWTGRAKIRREGELADDQPVITTDSRSNSLIIASNRDDYEVIRKLVGELEQQKLSPIAQIRSVKVEHSDTTKIADMLRKLFDERSKMKPAGQENVLEDRVAIVEDPLSKMLFIASTQSNYDEIVRLVSQIDVEPVVNGIIRTFFIKNADATKAAEMLNKMFTNGIIYPGGGDRSKLPESLTKVSIVPDVRSSAILVSASPENMLLIEDMLKQIDRVDMPILQAEARFFQLENADVLRVADMLDQLFEGMRNSSPDIKDQLQMKVVPNTRTNVLAISGSRPALQRAAELIPMFDKKAEAGAPTSAVEIYTLKNAPAPRLAQVLTDMFEKREQGTQGKVTPISIIGDETSNSLIVTAPREKQDIVRDLLTRLDVPSALAGQMEVITLREADPEQVADTLTKLMQQQQQGSGQKAPSGFAITPEKRTNSLLVFAPKDAMANIRSIVQKLDGTKSTKEVAMRVYPLRNARAEDLQKLLTDFFKTAGLGDTQQARQMIVNFIPVDPSTGKPMINPDTGAGLVQRLVHQDITISADPYTNSLMVMAPSESIDMMAMLVEMLDSVTPVTAQLQVFPLLNADATEMKDLLTDLFEAKGTGAGAGGQRQIVLAGGEGGGTLAASSTGGTSGTVAEVLFGVDQRTNSLIAAGSPSYLKIVEDLVLKLDLKEIEERIVRVVHLRNAKADEVSETMKAYFDDEAQAIEKASEGEARPRQLQRHVTITDSGETANSLLLSYSPRMESQIISMINELDQPPPQVMIQVLMAEVTLNDRFEMGMEFQLQDLLFSEGASVRQTPNGPIIQGDHFDTIFGTDIGASGSGSGLNFTVTGEDFNFLFHALQTEGRLEVLSRPSILVRDNQEATFTVGERVPTVQDINISSTGQITPSVTYEEVGVILGVTPIINPDGFVNLDIEPEISAIGTSSVTVATGVTLPTFTQRKAETSVTVKDGETIIIGGLITSQENSSDTKVPLAGDIPILGWAFRSTTRSTTKTELLIVLTPHVIRDPTQARAVSVHMRDQTGLNDNIRQSPLMQGLQVKPEEDQFGPLEPIKPGGTMEPYTPAQPRTDEQGPELEEYGPPVTSLAPAGRGSQVNVEFGPVVNRPARTGVTAAAR